MFQVKKLMMILALVVCFFAVQQSEAATLDDAVRKLGRGVCNAALGALEIPIRIWDTNKTEGGFASVTYGVFKGIAYFIGRELVGVCEIVTFPFPLPGCAVNPEDPGWGYGPIMWPEWVVDDQHDPFNFVYPQTDIVI